MDNKEYRYIQFPLCLLTDTFVNATEGIENILGYGIMNYALKMNYDMTDVAKQLLYYYFRKRKIMQRDLRTKLEVTFNENLFICDDDNPGFNFDGEFDPPIEDIEALLKLFENDQKFKDNAILNYQIHAATMNDQLNIELSSHDSIINRYTNAIRAKQEFEKKFGTDATASCKVEMLFNFRDNPEKDINILRAYIGLNSMIGRRNFISTNKPAILSRMVGCKSKEAFDNISKKSANKELRNIVAKYGKRYHMDNLLKTLANQEFIMFASREKVSVIYISKYMEPEELIRLIEATKDRQDIRQRIRRAYASLAGF